MKEQAEIKRRLQAAEEEWLAAAEALEAGSESLLSACAATVSSALSKALIETGVHTPLHPIGRSAATQCESGANSVLQL